jgi:hypothetical protein
MRCFSKKVLVASVMAGLSASAFAAEKKGPTLGDMLEASGVSLSGYIDVTYTNHSTDANTTNFHPYTGEENSFNLNALDVAISKLPAKGFGGMVEMMAGEDVTFNASKGSGATNFDLLQTFIQYADGGLTVMGGKFTTLAGAEVAQAPANANLSRSLLYTLAIPVTHTGLRGVYAPGDTMKFTVGLNNGWDVLRESDPLNCVGATCADGKTVELGASFNPSKMFGLVASYYMGEEAGVTNVGDRTLLDLVATFNATDALIFVLNYDMGDQDSGTAAGGTAEWNGWAAYANYAFSDKLRGSLRIESFDDKDGFRTGTVQELESLTLTVGYAPTKSVDLRAEFRQDESDQNVFTENGAAKDSETFFGIEGIYKF